MNAPSPATAHSTLPDGAATGDRFQHVRATTLALAAPLSAEDAMLQSMPDASPAKWHLAHTSWFFERFVLALLPGYRALHPDWDVLLNSYYQGLGPQHPRPQRGLLSRPTLEAVRDYRAQVDARMATALAAGDFDAPALQRIELGCHHEQQHQELLLTDIQHAFWCNPLRPAYHAPPAVQATTAAPLQWIARDEQIDTIGTPAWPQSNDFAFDNESPRHRVLVPAHALASRPASNAEYRAFIDDGGYARSELWLSAGWAHAQLEGWTHPLYWDDDLEHAFGLSGMQRLHPHAPVSHLSHYEADAFARWAGARLPTEAEWESQAHAALAAAPARTGNFLDDGLLQPCAADPARDGLQQLLGTVWEWTGSAYLAYPGFQPLPGALGEYNGKFMSGQQVLRGGSCFTPRTHARTTYRNFFRSQDRWQCTGVRLARDLP